jgi:hypothetical protein
MGRVTVLLAGMLVGCAASSTPTNTPSGRAGFEIECGSDRQDCLAEAGEQCGSAGYKIISEDWHRGAFWKRNYSMTVECGDGSSE